MKGFLVSPVLSDDRRLRPRLRLILLVAGVYAMSLLAQWRAVVNGMADPLAIRWLVGFIVIGVCGTYLLVRSGMTRQLADPPLTRPQMVLGSLAIAVFSLVMGWGVLREPATFDPQIEARHYMFVTVVLLTMSALTAQFSRLRSSWRRQNRELKEALARLAEG